MLAVRNIKKCSSCQVDKPLELFCKNRQFKDGLSNVCKECASSYAKQKAKHNGILMIGLKYCIRCKKELPVNQFRIDKYFGGSRYSYCRSCERERGKAYHLRHKQTCNKRSRKYHHENYDQHKDYLLRRMYGINKKQYDDLLMKQWGVCAICGKSPQGRKNALHVDHDHETQITRGLLCSTCNTSIGGMLDSPLLLEKAAAYLRSYSERNIA